MQPGTDSISWPPEFSELKRLDVILKCGICYDFMQNCMITSCSHTFCSLCIRRFMQYKNQCPTCYEETFEIQLRNNRLLDEVISVYTKIRDKLLRASRLASVTVPPKYETKENKVSLKDPPSNTLATDSSHTSFQEDQQKKDEKKTANENERKPEAVKTPLKKVIDHDSVVVNGVKVPGMFTSPKMSCIRIRKPDELTDCPVCAVKVPAKNINMHLDSCLALDPANKPKSKIKKRSPLPKRVYTMMSDKNLKKFLKEYGLNTGGDRKAMTARLQRYTVIYNAENDALTPRPVTELIKQLEREEREEKKPKSILKNLQPAVPRVVVFRNDIDAIDKANKAYCKENKTSFMKLIEEMKAREGRNIKPLKPINRIYSDDEDDPNRVVSTSCDEPTTSGLSAQHNVDNSEKKIENSHDSDSDGDIFMDPVETTDKYEISRIDWNKTYVESDIDESNESIYNQKTQQVSTIDLTCEHEKDEKSDNESSLEKSDSFSTEYGSETDSLELNTSKPPKRKNNTKTEKKQIVKPTRNSTRGRRRLSLSWKRATKVVVKENDGALTGPLTTRTNQDNLANVDNKDSDEENDSEVKDCNKISDSDEDGNVFDERNVSDEDNLVNANNKDKTEECNVAVGNDEKTDSDEDVHDNGNITVNGDLAALNTVDKVVALDFNNKNLNSDISEAEKNVNELVTKETILDKCDTSVTIDKEPVLNGDSCIEEADSNCLNMSPMKRLTRSAKRKSSSIDLKLEQDITKSSMTSRKKSKRDSSPKNC